MRIEMMNSTRDNSVVIDLGHYQESGSTECQSASDEERRENHNEVVVDVSRHKKKEQKGNIKGVSV